jgi:hypothetical protein
MTYNRLATALKFTEDDLLANQRGRISDTQRQAYLPPAVSRIAIYVVLGHAVLLLGIFGTIAVIVNKPAMWGVLLIVSGLALLPFFVSRGEFLRRPVVQDDVARGKVASVCGMVELPYENNRYGLRIENTTFNNLTLKVWGAFSPQKTYCIYYLPQSQIILSAEEIATP